MTTPSRELSIEDSYRTAGKYAQFAHQQLEMAFENLQRALQAASIDSGRWEMWKSYIDMHREIEETKDKNSPEYRKLVRKYEQWRDFDNSNPAAYVEHQLMSSIHFYMNEGWMLRQGTEVFDDPQNLADWRLRNGIATDEDYDEE